MRKQAKQMKQVRKRYSPEYRKEALILVDKIGVSAAAKQLGLHDSQLYMWRSKTRRDDDKGVVEQQLATENARLKRMLAERDEELAILKKAAAYFAKNQK